MQLMWVSGPTGRVRTISITFKKVVVAALVASFSLVVTGFLLYLVGFKIAVETSPDLARTLGGVTTEAEQQRMEAIVMGKNPPDPFAARPEVGEQLKKALRAG